MQKAIGLGIMVLAIWTALELFTRGPAEAFDGAFASFLSDEERAAEYISAPQRAGNKLRKAHEDRSEAIGRLTQE